MKRSSALVIFLTLALFVPGCSEQECTPQQHHEVMKSIRETQGYYVYDAAILASALSKRTPLDIFHFRETAYRQRIIRSISRICRLNGTSYRAFDRAHAGYGLLNLTYTEEVKGFVEMCHHLSDEYQDKQGRLFGFDDLTYDLGASYHLLIVIDDEGRSRIDGLPIEDSELDKELEDYYHSKGVDRAIWHLKTYTEVKAGQVFDLMDRIFEIFLSDSCRGIGPVDGKFTFSELTDTTQDRLNRLISPDFHNPGFNTFSGSDFVIHVTESDDIFLNGKPQSSTAKLVENLATQYNPEKGSKVYVAVDDEALWSKALEVGRRLRDRNLWYQGSFLRSKNLARLETMKNSQQAR